MDDEDDDQSVMKKAMADTLSRMSFTERLASSRRLQWAWPGYGTCFRCNCPWSVVPSRSVWYEESHGCFALCTICWAELGNANNRVPYYMALVKQWDEDNSVEDVQGTMDRVAAAVVTASLEET